MVSSVVLNDNYDQISFHIHTNAETGASAQGLDCVTRLPLVCYFMCMSVTWHAARSHCSEGSLTCSPPAAGRAHEDLFGLCKGTMGVGMGLNVQTKHTGFAHKPQNRWTKGEHKNIKHTTQCKYKIDHVDLLGNFKRTKPRLMFLVTPVLIKSKCLLWKRPAASRCLCHFLYSLCTYLLILYMRIHGTVQFFISYSWQILLFPPFDSLIIII